MKSILIAIVALACTVPFLAAGCSGGTSVADACQQQCDCNTECEKSDLDECQQKGKTAEAQADKAGCSAEFADVTSCASST